MKNSLRTGTALALTVGIGYIACSIIFWIWPAAAMAFMNGLFHGLDFGRLQTTSAIFDFSSTIEATLILMAWAFGLGTLFGLIHDNIGHWNVGATGREAHAQR